MRALVSLSLLLLIVVADAMFLQRGMTEKDFDKVRLGKEGFEKTQMIHYNWYLHSIKAIMGQLGKDLKAKLDKPTRTAFLRCLDAIKDKRDVVSAARCLVHARNEHKEAKLNRKEGIKSVEDVSFKTLPDVSEIKNQTRIKSVEDVSFKTLPEVSEVKKVNPLDTMEAVIQIKESPKAYRKPTKKRYRKKKINLKKHLMRKYQERQRALMRRRMKRSPYRLTVNKMAKSDTPTFLVKNMDRAPDYKPARKSPVKTFSKLVKMFFAANGTDAKMTETGTAWGESYKSLLMMKKSMDERAKMPGAKVYEMRMLDLVLDRKKATSTPGEKINYPPLLKNAYDLIHAIEGSSKDVGDASNIKFMSPRFAAVMPDKSEIRGKLSPSILSFYKDDTEEQILPIPKLLESAGLDDQDRETLLETMMEISGARQTVDDAMKVLGHMNLFGMEGELKEVTERIAANFKQLEQSFNRRQKGEIKRRGFTFMENNQIDELYSKQGIRQHDDVGFDREEYRNLTRLEREEALWLRIEAIAHNSTEPIRSKRQLPLLVLKPTVLAPYMFTPIVGFSVLGPTVLSPSLFSPLLLNPAVLSPYVLSPAIGMPFILSPYLLSPYVLSPIIMAPFILNPYVLSPNVVNPYVLSPLILSPLVLCPDLVSPQVLGGAILSPAVASPSILSKSVLMASVLSPSILSKK